MEIICLKRPMARPLRIEYPGAYYHVMNRGNRREDIFLTDKDRQVFLDGLADSCEIYSITLITYVLMSNHFHLLVQTPQANLSEFMRHFLVTYTVRFNRRNARAGHVFQGRFKSLLVDEDEYLLPMSRYIHLNPIRTSRFKDTDFQTRQMAMELSYRYSNYKQKEIGVIFGVDYSTVSQSRSRLKTKLKSNRKLKHQFHRIREQINKLSNPKI